MAANETRTEQHGCIVCGKTYHLRVTYAPGGQYLKCHVTGGGARCLPDPQLPLVACSTHSAADVQAALAGHYPGAKTAEDEEDE